MSRVLSGKLQVRSVTCHRKEKLCVKQSQPYWLLCVYWSSTVKVVGTVTPKEPVEDWDAAWEFSSGDELFIRWDSSGSISELGLRSSKPGSLV